MTDIHKHVAPYLYLVVFFFISCTSSKTDNKQLNITIINSTSEYGVLYGFMGDKQIAIDTLFLDNNTIEYNISEKCNTGVYRLILENGVPLEFIYNNEDITLSFDETDFPNSLNELTSKENDLFVSFYKDIYTYQNMVQNQSSEITEEQKREQGLEYRNLFNKYLNQKDAKSYYAYSVIEFLYQPDYQTYLAISEDTVVNEESFMMTKYFAHKQFTDERLLASPYVYIIIESYLQYFATKSEESFALAAKQIQSKTSDNEEIALFVNTTIFESAINHNKKTFITEHLNAKYADKICMGAIDSLNSKPSVSLGATVNSDENTKYVCMLFTNDKCPATDSVTTYIDDVLSTSAVKNIQFSKHIITENNSSLATQYNVFAYPYLAVYDSNGLLLSRWYGEDEIKTALRSIDVM